MLVPFLFFCSGATALVYEVVWSKYLTLMFGSTVQAQTVVLAVFMGALGMVSSLQMTALVNLLVGLTAVGLARREGEMVRTETATTPTSESASNTFRWSCALVALTGGVSMGLEVLASRSLVLILGASLQAFSIVLMAFILGIGLGSGVVASPRWHRLRRETSTCALLLIAAGWIGVLVLGITTWVEFYMRAKTGLAASEMGYRFHQLLAAGMSMVVLGVPAGLLGAVLPLWIRSLGAESKALGDQVGRLLTWNTVGAVAGVLLTGFGLMPHVGLRASFYVLVVGLCLGAFLIALA